LRSPATMPGWPTASISTSACKRDRPTRRAGRTTPSRRPKQAH
jgi:hypothetical protein